MANIELRPIKTAAQCKAELAEASKRLARRIRQIESQKPLQVSLGKALAAALK